MSRVDAPVVGVILAAGKGARILPFSERYPKPILPILGKPLLQHQIECLRDIGVEADLILFHAYDRWGFSDLGPVVDDR